MLTNSFEIYVLKVNILIAILFCFYRIFFHKSTYHNFNRFILLFILLFALICPLLKFRHLTHNNLLNNTIWINNISDQSQENATFSTAIKDSIIPNLHQIIYGIYILGFGLFTYRFSKQILRIIHLRQEAKPMNKGNNIFQSTKVNAHFTFFNWIFIPAWHAQIESDNTILEHEKAHRTQWHSLDSIFIELFCIIFWFNPFVFLLKNSIKETHEFLADKKAIQSNNSIAEYLSLLAKSTEMNLLIGISNHFKCKTFKNRIDMITIIRSSKIKKFSYLLLLPLLALLVWSFARGTSNNSIPNRKPIAEENIKKISSEYGMREHPITHKMAMHNGIDFSANLGTPVVATADGVVIQKDFLNPGKGYGRVLLIQHSETFSTFYTQLSEFKVDSGDYVTQGDVIGLVGQSGISTGPHLHYEVWKNGEKVNPADYFE